MAERISLALAVKGLSFRTSSLTNLNINETTRFKLIELGFPLLLIGKEGACGWVAALDLMEKARPEPSLFPNGNRGMPIALSFWSDHAATKTSENGNFSPYVELISRQIADGRRFLQGDAPGLADIESYIAVSSAARDGLPALVSAWRKRMSDLKSSVSSQPVDTSEAEHQLQNLKNLAVSPVDLDR
ncbi:MAG: hypothetical protein E2O41_04345 [Nitrospina sp.]|nr:MAG: hypothetical protein E2O41_04345 [Nitrospina sp.]